MVTLTCNDCGREKSYPDLTEVEGMAVAQWFNDKRRKLCSDCFERDQLPFTVTFTGHRDIKLGDTEFGSKLTMVLWGLKEAHPDIEARCGMAAGGDLIFGTTCQTVLNIPVHAFIPDPGYKKHYVHGEWAEMFDEVLAAARSVEYAADYHDWRNNFTRNESMMRGAHVVLAGYRYDDIGEYTASYRPRKGGTAHGIKTALSLGRTLGSDLVHIPCQ